MGGNAIKVVKVKRLDSVQELQRVQAALSKTLTEYDLNHEFPIELPGKESFGDVDVLIDLRHNVTGNIILTKDKIRAWMNEVFAPEEIHVNGPVYSMSYEGCYQVDFIVVDNLQMARFYFSFGEVGAVLGRCVRAHNLTYGHQGLLTLGINGDRSILLTENPQHICEYFALDFAKWQRGFENVDELNRWIISSNLFDVSLFSNLNMSHRRQSLRPFYRQFLDFTESLEANSEWTLRDLTQHAVEHFDRTAEVAELLREKEVKALNKLKFNAQLFAERGVETRQLAKTMKAFKSEHPQVDSLTAEEILVLIDEFLKSVQM